MTRLASIAPGDQAKKAGVEKKLTNVWLTICRSVLKLISPFQRLNQWFINRASAANSGNRHDISAWLPLIQRLHQLRNPRPRSRTVVQQFMVDYRREVNAAFVSRHGDGKNFSATQRLNLLHSVAKAMLSNEYSCHLNEVEKRMKAYHDGEVEKWNLTLEGIESADDVDQYVFCFRF